MIAVEVKKEIIEKHGYASGQNCKILYLGKQCKILQKSTTGIMLQQCKRSISLMTMQCHTYVKFSKGDKHKCHWIGSLLTLHEKKKIPLSQQRVFALIYRCLDYKHVSRMNYAQKPRLYCMYMCIQYMCVYIHIYTHICICIHIIHVSLLCVDMYTTLYHVLYTCSPLFSII